MQLASGLTSEKASTDTGSHALSGEDAGRYQANLTTSYGPNGSVGEASVRRDRDRELGPSSKTRIGAIGVLSSDICVDSRAYFVHNMHAANPIPPERLDPWPHLMPGLVARNSPDDYWR